MNFDYPLTFNALKFMLIMVRVGAFMFAMPVVNQKAIPPRYRVFLTVFLTVIFMPIVPEELLTPILKFSLNILSLTMILISEAILGVCIALAFYIAKEILGFGGQLFDRNAGFLLAGAFDPDAQGQITPFSHLLMNTFIISMLISNSHLDIIRYMAASFNTVSPGEFFISTTTFKLIIAFAAKIFIIGTQIAMPIIISVLFLNIALAFMSRIGQDFQVLMISFPLRIVFSFMLLTLLFPVVLQICRIVTSQFFTLINNILI
ncbi:flagellar biosynthetic protein FliR [Lentisphaerota bacterium WC36G]|nr:flagellar biosynthetic protein FliR [Lentisphaerae bacterium WC36]